MAFSRLGNKVVSNLNESVLLYKSHNEIFPRNLKIAEKIQNS